MASLRNIAVTVRLNGVTSVADALRHHARAPVGR
jgi:hypothetical protein